MSPLLKGSFFAVMFLYLFFPAQMVFNSENLLKDGLLYKFKPVPVDPYDAFRGRYVSLRYNMNSIKQSNPENDFFSGDIAYVQIEKDSTGFAYYAKAFNEKPDIDNYIECTVSGLGKDEIYLRIPENLTLYYMNEKLAPLAEEYYRTLSRTQSQIPEQLLVHVNVRLKRGKAMIEEMYFENQAVGDYLETKESN